MAGKPEKPTELMKALGVAVKTARVRLGLSQEGLADRAHLDRSYMSQIERGIKNATLASIHRIAKALGIDASDLIRRTEAVLAEGVEIAQKERRAAGARKVGSILVVDDDEDICQTIASVFNDAGLEAVTATSGFDALQVVATGNVKVVISDVRMANGNGLELLAAVLKHYPAIPVFLITGYDDMSAEDAEKRGARELFNKPFDIRRLLTSVQSALGKSESLS